MESPAAARSLIVRRGKPVFLVRNEQMIKI